MALLAEHLHEGGLRIASLWRVVIVHEIFRLSAPGTARFFDVTGHSSTTQELADALCNKRAFAMPSVGHRESLTQSREDAPIFLAFAVRPWQLPDDTFWGAQSPAPP